MKTLLHPRRLMLLLTIVSLALGGQTLAGAAPTDDVSSLSRTTDPVIITGAELPFFLDVPVNDLFVYAYDGSAWAQIPAQIDEVNASGRYVASEDGVFDSNDELVFMAKDLGDQSGGLPPKGDQGEVVSLSWYQVAVTDPLNPGQQAWGYVVASDTASQTFTDDYVSFNASLHRITGGNYQLGFASPRPWLNYLALGASGDILDRAPKSKSCVRIIILICPTEEDADDVPDDLIKDGPVRLIVRNGRVLAYGARAESIVAIDLSFTIESVRFSTDFSPSASGSTFYNAVVPAGVTVDGVPDVVPATPFSRWWQVSTGTGTMIQVSDVSELGGTPTNYYVDNSATDSADTGDKKHYGDNGISVNAPNSAFTYRFTIYFLDGQQPNVGATYAGYFDQSLTATAQWQELQQPERLYLPLNLRTG